MPEGRGSRIAHEAKKAAVAAGTAAVFTFGAGESAEAKHHQEKPPAGHKIEAPKRAGTSKIESHEPREAVLRGINPYILQDEFDILARQLPEQKREKFKKRVKTLFIDADEMIFKRRLKGEGQERKYFSKMLEKFPEIMQIIEEACKDNKGHINRELVSVMLATISGETAMRYSERNKNSELPVGPYQIERYTARVWGLRVRGGVDERFDFKKTSGKVAEKMKGYYEKYGQWGLAMFAFNRGAGNLDSFIRNQLHLRKREPITASRVREGKINLLSLFDAGGKTRKFALHQFQRGALLKRFVRLVVEEKLAASR